VSRLKERQVEEFVDGFAVDLLGPRPVVVGHWFEDPDAGVAHASFESAFLSLAFFQSEHVAQPWFIGNLFPAGDEAKETKSFETSLELGLRQIGGHRLSSFLSVS
jgi:hypothetical protein